MKEDHMQAMSTNAPQRSPSNLLVKINQRHFHSMYPTINEDIKGAAKVILSIVT